MMRFTNHYFAVPGQRGFLTGSRGPNSHYQRKPPMECSTLEIGCLGTLGFHAHSVRGEMDGNWRALESLPRGNAEGDRQSGTMAGEIDTIPAIIIGLRGGPKLPTVGLPVK